MNEAAAPVKVPEFVTCLGQWQPRAGAEQGPQLHRAGGIGVDGIWRLEIHSLILARTGRLFLVNASLFPSKNTTALYLGKKKPNPPARWAVFHRG